MPQPTVPKLHVNETRLSRRGPDGVLYQWSNSVDKPEGEGWNQVNKAQFPRVRTFVWFRPASYVHSDVKKVEDAAADMSSSGVISKFSDVLFHPLDQLRQRWAALTRQKVSVIPGARVTFGGQVYYATSGVGDLDQTVKIKHPITGEVKQVNAAELNTKAPTPQNSYAVGDVVKLAAGVIDKNEYEVLILGQDKRTGKYRVTLSTKKPELRAQSFEVYPESINAFVTNRADNPQPVLAALSTNEFLLASNHDKQIVETLHRALAAHRTSISVDEVVADAKARGEYIGAHEVILAASELQRINPNIQYNAANGNIFIGTSKHSIEAVMRSRAITPLDIPLGSKNLTQDNDKETYGYAGQKVRTKDGNILEAVIDSVIGDIATIMMPDRKMRTFKLDELEDENRRNLLRDPAAPKHVGQVKNKEAFWILRDREHVNTYKVGDPAVLMPGVSNLARNKDQPMNGKVQNINDDGTVDVAVEDSGRQTVVRAFGRQLLRTPQFSNPKQFQEYLQHNAESLYNKTFKVGNTHVEIGDRVHDSHGQKKLSLTFQNGSDYQENEHLWLQPLPSQSNASGIESVIQALGHVFSKQTADFSATLGPSRYLVGILDELFPAAQQVTLARDTTTSPQDIGNVAAAIKVSVTIDDDKIRGKKFSMDRLHQEYNQPSGVAITPASSIDNATNSKMWIDNDHLYINLSKLHAAARPRTSKSSMLGSDTMYFPELKQVDEDNRENPKYKPEGGPSFFDVVDTPQHIKQLHWAMVPNGQQLIHDSSVFTYDKDNDRYMVSLADYNEAHRFMRAFFGNTLYDHMWETENRGYYAKAADKLLQAQAAKFKHDFIKPEDVSDTPMVIDGFYQTKFNKVLRPYQNQAVRFMLKTPQALLAMDQGTGKTVAAIAANIGRLNELNAREPLKKHKVLIVAPASVALTSWAGDLRDALNEKTSKDTYGKSKYNFVTLLGKDRSEGYKKLLDPKDRTAIALTSYHTFALQDWQEIKDLDFDIVTLDEAQQISGDAATRNIITSRLGLLGADVRYKTALTGTPLENRPEDLQAILAWLNPSLFGDQAKFNRDFIENDYVIDKDSRGKPVKRLRGIRLKNLGALQTRLSRYMFRLEKFDLLTKSAPRPDATKFAVNRDDFLQKWLPKYRSALTSPQDKQRIGELSVIPGRITPKYEIVSSGDNHRIKYTDHTVPLTMEGYDDYKDMIVAAKSAIRDSYMAAIAAGTHPNPSTYLLRLQQAANDPSLLANAQEFTPEQRQMFASKRVRNPKVDRLMSLINQQWPTQSFHKGENGKIIVFAEHVGTLNFLEKELLKRYPNLRGKLIKFMGQGADATSETKQGFKTKMAVTKAFNEDPHFDYPIMLATNAAKTGVNLPAANTVINYDLTWNPADTEQRIDRAHRVRSIKEIVASNTAPAREVYAHNLMVLGPDGGINDTIEARKMFSHWSKRSMFDMLVRGKPEEDYKSQKDERGILLAANENQEALEKLLDVQNPTAPIRGTDKESTGRALRQRQLQRRQRELEKRYGGDARYLRGYTDLSHPID